jgi:hypothetical protein
VTASTARRRRLQFSVDNGTTFFNASGNYLHNSSNGAVSNQPQILFGTASSTGAMSSEISLTGNNSGIYPRCTVENELVGLHLFAGSTLPINAAKFDNVIDGNLTGGRLIVLGR